MDVTTAISIIVGAVSVVVSSFAIWLAQSAGRESRANYEKTKDVLAEIDKKATVIETIVADNQRELLETVKKLAIPEKPDPGEEIGLEFLKAMTRDPDSFNKMLPTLMQLSQQVPHQSGSQ